MRHTPSIIYQDDDLIIVDKPANYLTIPDRHNHALPSVIGFLERTFAKVWIVHRLDRETSGLMCFALNAEAHRHLSMQFENREIKKIYWALVDGCPNPTEGEINAPLAPDPQQGGKMRVHRDGKRSLTAFRVLERWRNFSLVEADIKTGRMHQIRVHFAYLGNPLAVDALYGRRSELFLSEIKRKYKTGSDPDEERPLMSRSTLHARKLTLKHPSTGKMLDFESALPKDFQALLSQLSKWGN